MIQNWQRVEGPCIALGSEGAFDDGSLRIWYASRPAPPFVHKYYAIGTAHWKDPLSGT